MTTVSGESNNSRVPRQQQQIFYSHSKNSKDVNSSKNRSSCGTHSNTRENWNIRGHRLLQRLAQPLKMECVELQGLLKAQVHRQRHEHTWRCLSKSWQACLSTLSFRCCNVTIHHKTREQTALAF